MLAPQLDGTLPLYPGHAPRSYTAFDVAIAASPSDREYLVGSVTWLAHMCTVWYKSGDDTREHPRGSARRYLRLLLVCLVLAVGLGLSFAMSEFAQVQRPVKGSLLVASLGDVNLDLRVDRKDLRVVARHLARPVPSGDVRAAFAFGDVNLDGQVNVLDVAIVGSEFEERG